MDAVGLRYDLASVSDNFCGVRRIFGDVWLCNVNDDSYSMHQRSCHCQGISEELAEALRVHAQGFRHHEFGVVNRINCHADNLPSISKLLQTASATLPPILDAIGVLPSQVRFKSSKLISLCHWIIMQLGNQNLVTSALAALAML